MKKDCSVAKIVTIVLVVVATLAALGAGYALVRKLLSKKKGCCDVALEGEGCADCCFDNSDCADCPIVEDVEYAEVPVDGE